MTSREYSPGRRAHLFGSPDHGIALLWHGRGIDQGRAMQPIAERVAAAGLLAISVDWSSEEPDRGRGDLMSSLRFARELASEHGLDPDRIVLAGWSLGATAALGVAMHTEALGTPVAGVVLIAPGDGPRAVNPTTGTPLPATFPAGSHRAPITLVFGQDDLSSTPDLVSGLELRLRAAGWTTSLHAVDADHAGVVGARFDERTERYLPSRTGRARAAADTVADLVVAATRPSSPGSRPSSSPAPRTGLPRS